MATVTMTVEVSLYVPDDILARNLKEGEDTLGLGQFANLRLLHSAAADGCHVLDYKAISHRVLVKPPPRPKTPSVPETTAVWKPLPYATPMELWRAFKSGTKFALHYHGKTSIVTHMEPRAVVAYVQPPGLAVKVLPDGRSAEGPGPGIWLEQLKE